MKFVRSAGCWVIFIAFCYFVDICRAYSGVIPPSPDEPGKCYYRGDLLKIGQTSGSAPCQRLTCYEDGSILIEGCGKLFIPNCNRGERMHMGKPYPECCKLIYKCKNADGSSYYIEKDVASEHNNAENLT